VTIVPIDIPDELLAKAMLFGETIRVKPWTETLADAWKQYLIDDNLRVMARLESRWKRKGILCRPEA
jgi:hypothetical protein